MDHFLTMRSFVEVVKRGSYTEAARTLGTSRALVSRHILDLEHRLKVRLLNRTTRSITLTEGGQHYFDFCDRILQEIKENEEQITGKNREPEGNLAVIAPKWIGNYEISDAATSFSIEYPDISLKLSLGGMAPNAYDFVDRGYDIALHTRQIPDSLIRVKKITSIDFVLVASAKYLDEHPPITHPDDLTSHKGLVQVNDPIWRLETESESIKVRMPVVFSSNTYIVLRKAAVKGLGLAVLPKPIVEQDLVDGTLRHVLPQYPIEARPLYAAFAPGTGTPLKVRLFIDFLTNWFKQPAT